MSSWVAKKCKVPITIQIPSGAIVDGKSSFTTISSKCLFFDFSQADLDYFGAIKNGKIFLVAPLSTPPPVDAKIIHNETEYDIKAVKVYRNLKGEVLAYRCAVAGAGE